MIRRLSVGAVVVMALLVLMPALAAFADVNWRQWAAGTVDGPGVIVNSYPEADNNAVDWTWANQGQGAVVTVDGVQVCAAGGGVMHCEFAGVQGGSHVVRINCLPLGCPGSTWSLRGVNNQCIGCPYTGNWASIPVYLPQVDIVQSVRDIIGSGKIMGSALTYVMAFSIAAIMIGAIVSTAKSMMAGEKMDMPNPTMGSEGLADGPSYMGEGGPKRFTKSGPGASAGGKHVTRYMD